MKHRIEKRVKAEVYEAWNINQDTGEPDPTDDYSAEQYTTAEKWLCSCGLRFNKAETAVAHQKKGNR